MRKLGLEKTFLFIFISKLLLVEGGVTFPNIIPENLFHNEMASESTKEKSEGVKSKTLLEPIIIHHKGRMKEEEGKGLCEGACIPQRSCDYHGGTPKGHCASGSVCCIFERSCGGISREKIAFFKSPNYPMELNESLHCSFEIYANEGVCAFRIEFETFKMEDAVQAGKVDKCYSDAFYILNSGEGPNEPICQMENHTAIVFINQNSSRPLTLLFVAQSQQFKWNLKITQLNCAKLKEWKNEPGCGRQLMYEATETEDLPGEEDERSVNNALIVNGKDADQREFPWQISLQVMPRHSHRCGASILNSKYILTAAHCLIRGGYESGDGMRVIVGDYMLNGTEDGIHKEFEIESVIVHWHYKPQLSHLNDIAVIKVKGEIEFDGRVQPICLPPKDWPIRGGETAWVSGWGRLNGTDPKAKANVLQKLKVNLIEEKECRKLVKVELEEVLKRNLSSSEITQFARLGTSKTQLCARPKLHSAVCFGDSGGPLVVQQEEDGSFMQVGVVSYGLGKCITERNPPAAYTRISQFLQFIALATSNQ